MKLVVRICSLHIKNFGPRALIFQGRGGGGGGGGGGNRYHFKNENLLLNSLIFFKVDSVY